MKPFDLQPTLENTLVRLRPLRDEDLETLFHVASDPLLWEQHPNHDRHQRPVFEAFFRDAMASKGALAVINQSDQIIIGSSRYQLRPGLEHAVEIGWSFLARDFWGGEYNFAMKTLMLDHAFRFVEHVVFYIGKENLRSQKAVEKIGGTRLTGDRHRELIRQNEEDYTYLISKSGWESRNR